MHISYSRILAHLNARTCSGFTALNHLTGFVSLGGTLLVAGARIQMAKAAGSGQLQKNVFIEFHSF